MCQCEEKDPNPRGGGGVENAPHGDDGCHGLEQRFELGKSLDGSAQAETTVVQAKNLRRRCLSCGW